MLTEFVSLIAVLFADGEQAAGETVMPSVGRGMQLPPICDVALPRAYYDELPAHVITRSGIGRGQQSGVNSIMEVPGQRSYFVPECSGFEAHVPVYSEEFPELVKGREAMVISDEKSDNQPQQRQPETSLKTVAAQFARAK